MNILVCGDSFSADWSVKYPDCEGWVNSLSKKYNIKNNSQAGCSEYKIYKQLCSEDVNLYDIIIISHTSPYRIPVEKHPILYNDCLHKNADLIYADIKNQNSPDLECISKYFERYFDMEHADFVHKLIIKEQIKHINNTPCLHISYYNSGVFKKLENFYCFKSILQKHRGLINHFSSEGNKKLTTIVDNWIMKNHEKTNN